jgi:hypothetical protein
MQVEAYIAVSTIYLEIELDDEEILAALDEPENAHLSLEQIVENLARQEITETRSAIMRVRNVSDVSFHESEIHNYIPDLVEAFEEKYPQAKERHL